MDGSDSSPGLNRGRSINTTNKVLVLVLVAVLAIAVGLECGSSDTKTSKTEPGKRAEAKPEPVAKPKPEPAPEWEVVGRQGKVKLVYMSPDGLRDKHFIAQVLQELVRPDEWAQVLFFDSKAHTPHGYPMTDRQMLHWKAKYSRNPSTGHEEFEFLRVTDANTSPPEMEPVSAQIRPGYAK